MSETSNYLEDKGNIKNANMLLYYFSAMYIAITYNQFHEISEISFRKTVPVILVGISMVSTKVPGDTPSLNLVRMLGYDRKWVSNVRTSSTVLVWMWPCKKRRNQSDPSAKNTSSWLLPFNKHLRTCLEFKIKAMRQWDHVNKEKESKSWRYFAKLNSHARSVWDD